MQLKWRSKRRIQQKVVKEMVFGLKPRQSIYIVSANKNLAKRPLQTARIMADLSSNVFAAVKLITRVHQTPFYFQKLVIFSCLFSQMFYFLIEGYKQKINEMGGGVMQGCRNKRVMGGYTPQ